LLNDNDAFIHAGYCERRSLTTHVHRILRDR